MILLASVLAACVLLLILGFLAPRLSHRPQKEVDRGLDKADENAKKAPEPLDKLMHKPTEASRKAADTATQAGREARGKGDE